MWICKLLYTLRNAMNGCEENNCQFATFDIFVADITCNGVFYHCRLFFRRHCNLYCVTYCGLDTRGRRWVTASIKCYIIACLFRSSQLVIVSGQRFFLCHGRWMSSVLTQNVVLSSPNFFYGDGGPEVDNFLNLIISSLSSQFKLMGLRDNVRSSWAH